MLIYIIFWAFTVIIFVLFGIYNEGNKFLLPFLSYCSIKAFTKIREFLNDACLIALIILFTLNCFIVKLNNGSSNEAKDMVDLHLLWTCSVHKSICAAVLGVVVRIIICLWRENSVSVGQGRAKWGCLWNLILGTPLKWEKRKQRFWKNIPVDRKDTCSDVKAASGIRENSSVSWLPIETIEENPLQKTVNEISGIFFMKWRQSFKRVKKIPSSLIILCFLSQSREA